MNPNHNEVAIAVQTAKRTLINEFGEPRVNEMVNKKIALLQLKPEEAHETWASLTVDDVKNHPVYAVAVARTLSNNREVREYQAKAREMIAHLGKPAVEVSEPKKNTPPPGWGWVKKED